eukprot:scaffold25179_cov108-Cylindrotheca_fusiformis.AAC.1
MTDLPNPNPIPPTPVKENQFDKAHRKIKEFDEAKKTVRMAGQQDNGKSDFTWKTISTQK